MGVRRRHGCNLSAALALLFFFATALSSALVGNTQEKEESNFISQKQLEDQKWEQTLTGRRRLSGPGSSPPTCRSRCGRCFPCWPVHVAIQPGRSFPLEYYPEAWRCKCGNKLFMP